MSNEKDLSDVRNHLYDSAEILWRISLWLSLGAPFLSLIATFIGGNAFLSIAAVTALLTPVAVSWIRGYAGEVAGKADKCRRLILYSDGLGWKIPAEEIAAVRAWGIGYNLKPAPFISPYYASALPPGPNRLADIVTESAYFTEYLAGKMANKLMIILGLSVLLLVGILYIAGSLFVNLQTDTSVISIVTKSVATLIALLVSSDIFLLWKKYHDLKMAASNTVSRCSKMRKDSSVTAQEIMQVVEDYNIALLKSPPIPGNLYAQHKEALNEAYRTSHGIDS